MGTGAKLSNLIEQIRDLVSEEGEAPAPQKKKENPARLKKVMHMAGAPARNTEIHNNARVKADAHAQIHADHAKKGEHEKAIHHASLARQHYDTAAKAATAMGFHALAAAHQEKGQQMGIAAHHHSQELAKKNATKK